MDISAGLPKWWVQQGSLKRKINMNRKLMISAQVIVFFSLMMQLEGCIFVAPEHRGHWGHRGERYEHAESSAQLDIKIRN